MASFWQFCWHTDDILTFGPTPFLRIQSWDKKIRIQYFCLQTKKHSLVFIEVQKWKTVVSLFAFWQLPLRSPWVWFCYKNQSDCFISVKLVHYIDFHLKIDNICRWRFPRARVWRRRRHVHARHRLHFRNTHFRKMPAAGFNGEVLLAV